MQPERPETSGAYPDQDTPRSSRTLTEIKRSSWNAGMPMDFVQAPPGSPAAWQGRRRSQLATPVRESLSRDVMHTSHSSHSSVHSAQEPSTMLGRSPSPVRKSYLSVPTLQPIRSVSGSALGPEPQLEPEDALPHRHQSPPPNPFKFTSTYITPGKGTPGKGTAGPGPSARASQRRGHHYKHSSVSLNFFQEPEERAPLSIPVSLAVPTMREYYQSITKPQFMRLAWCVLRMVAAFFVYAFGSPIHSVAPLAHLLAYETIVSTTVACVEVLANFEVWNRSSLRFPFALKRAEVLVAFGLSTVLLFIGGDIVSHLIQELATGGDHGHHHHDGEHDFAGARMSTGEKRQHFLLLTLSMLTILPTTLREGSTNPLAMCTLGISGVLLVLPLLQAQLARFIDTVTTPLIAGIMIFAGYSSSKLFSGMLAMSYGGPDRSDTIRKMVCRDPSVAHVSDISLWQVHHDLWLASMRITISGSIEDERRVRTQAAKIVQEAVDVKDVEWETTIEIVRAELD